MRKKTITMSVTFVVMVLEVVKRSHTHMTNNFVLVMLVLEMAIMEGM
jgi:hypothetical protein